MAEIKKTSDGQNFVYHFTADEKNGYYSTPEQVISLALTERLDRNMLAKDRKEIFIMTDAQHNPLRMTLGSFENVTLGSFENGVLKLSHDYNWDPAKQDFTDCRLTGVPIVIDLPGKTAHLTTDLADSVQAIPKRNEITRRENVAETPDGKHLVYRNTVAYSPDANYPNGGYSLGTQSPEGLYKLSPDSDALAKVVNQEMALHPDLFKRDGVQQLDQMQQLFIVTDKNNNPERLFVAQLKDNKTIIDRTLNLNRKTNPSQAFEVLDKPIEVPAPKELPEGGKDNYYTQDLKNIAAALQKSIDSGKLVQVDKPHDAVQAAAAQFKAPAQHQDDSQTIIASANLAVDRFGAPATQINPNNPSLVPGTGGPNQKREIS